MRLPRNMKQLNPMQIEIIVDEAKENIKELGAFKRFILWMRLIRPENRYSVLKDILNVKKPTL